MVRRARACGLIDRAPVAAVDATGLETRHVSAHFGQRRARGKGHRQRAWPKLTVVLHAHSHLLLGAVPGVGPSRDCPDFTPAMRQAAGLGLLATGEGRGRWSGTGQEGVTAMVRVVTGLFETRRAAEIAVERMVQDRGFDRNRIHAFATGSDNSSGTVVSGADADDERHGEPVEGQRAGAIRVLAEVGEGEVETALEAFRDAGAAEVTTQDNAE